MEKLASIVVTFPLVDVQHPAFIVGYSMETPSL